MPQTILLAGQPFKAQERLAGETNILPGHLLKFGSGGTANRLLKHSTAAGVATAMFALENKMPDRSVATVPIDTPYASGETVQWIIARPGDEIYAWVPASAAAIIAGQELVSNGDGTLRLQLTGTATHSVVAMAAEAVDNSAGGTPARIRVHAI
jgi:hypothetical protein